MKRNLLVLAAVGAIALGGDVTVRAENSAWAGSGRCHGAQKFAVEPLTKSLSLTADQRVKVLLIIDQAQPQIIAIHRDAMEKTHAVIDKTMSQIRPILAPEQQRKFDELEKARQELRRAKEKMHNTLKD